MSLLVIDYNPKTSAEIFRVRSDLTQPIAIIGSPARARAYAEKGVDVIYYFMDESNSDALPLVESLFPDARIYAFSTGPLPARRGNVLPVSIPVQR